MHVRDEKCLKCWQETLTGSDDVRLEGAAQIDLGEKLCEHVECIVWLRTGYQWWALVNKVMNVRVP